MFTNFDNYHNPMNGNDKIYIIISLDSIFKDIVQAYSDMMVVDLIDKFYKKNNNSVYQYDFNFLFNGNKINNIDNMYLTLSELRIIDKSSIHGITLK